ncbi:O-methyltransferase [Dinghuibacter silviterrae]|nr:class I SAM-dependent methyltransferase [Dinghuibacter silviterrae]
MTAANGKGHGIHSPFVFDMVTRVFGDKKVYPAYGAIESLRRHLSADRDTTIVIDDLGAGTGGAATQQRRLSSIARTALKPPKFGQLFFRLAQYYKPSTILELGTSLGITTAYLASGNPSASVVTCEGAPAIASVARRTFDTLGLSRIRLVEGNFDDTLGSVLSALSSLDFAYIDGNHRLEPTLRYYRQMQPRLHNESILVFDDIHWSLEMEEAWAAVKADPMVTCTVDLFFIGLVFFRREFHTPQHFTIRF